jgi:1-acyl-sn-glycerol-3-phosphate acyltransferase
MIETPLRVPEQEPLAATLDSPLAGLVDLVGRASGRPAATMAADNDLTLDLGLDSLGRVELAALLAEELGLDLDDGAVMAVGTVGDLAALVATAATAAPTAHPPGTDFHAWARVAPARRARAALQQAALFPLVDRLCRPLQVEGLAQVRAVQPPFLLVANHTSHLDTAVILRALPPLRRARLAVAAAADYFYQRRVPGVLASLALGTFPLARQGDQVRASLDYCRRLVEQEWALLLYPEGTRAVDGRLQPFKPGAGLLATRLRLPVVPVHLDGLYTVLPKGTHWPRPGPVRVRFGTPLELPPSTSCEAATKALEDAVRVLSNERRACSAVDAE